MDYHEKREAIKNHIDMLQGFIARIKYLGISEEYKTEIAYFREIVKGLCIEKHFESVLKGANRDILQHLIKEKLNHYTRMENIESVFEVLYDTRHAVRNNLFYMDSMPVVKSILSICGFDLNTMQQANKTIRDIEKFSRYSKK